jgi:lactoylglutathione lyase/glyoxylase I family protein
MDESPKETAMIRSLAHVCLGSSDLERSVTFYRDQLGLLPAYEFVSATGEKTGQCLHLGGGTFLEVFRSKEISPPGHNHFCLEVADIEAAVAELRRRGVEVTKISKGSDRTWNAWLADPDGHRIELQQYTPESKQGPWIKR